MARASLFFDVFAVDHTKKTFSQIMRSTDTLGSKLAAFGKLAAVGAAVGVAAFATKGVKSFLAFDDAMTQSLAIMGTISGPMRDRMETAAREVGKTTRFSAEQAAEAYFFLASAGMDAQQSVAAMPKVAQFAQAGMFDLATATDLATDAQSALGLAAKNPEENLRNLTRVTDVLVGANTLANASVEQFATALTSKAGPAMRAAGIEIEEGVAVLAAFADQGIKGEAAGTRFTATLEGLQRNAINNAGAFEKLNVQVFDGQGNMRNFSDIIGDLEGALGGMSVEQQKAALMQLGFNRQALDGITALLGMSDQIRQYGGDLGNMAGVTEDVANNQLESFAAKWDLIKSKVEDFALSAGHAIVTFAFSVGEHIGEMARMFGELPDAIQIGIGGILAVGTAVPLVIGAFNKIKSGITALKTAYLALGTTAKITSASLGVIGIALAVGAGILAHFAGKNLDAKAKVQALTETLDAQTGALTDSSRAWLTNELEQSGALKAADSLGISLDLVRRAAEGEQDAVEQLNRILTNNADATDAAVFEGAEYGAVLDRNSNEVTTLEDVISGLNGALVDSREELERKRRAAEDDTDATKENKDATDEYADAHSDAADAIEEEVSQLRQLIDAADEAAGVVLSARDAERRFEDAIDKASDAVKENGKTLDITTEKGRKNQNALDDIAKSAHDQQKALESNGAAHDVLRGKMETARQQFIATATQMGLSKKAAEALADELGLIPSEVKTKVTVQTSGALAGIQAVKDKLAGIKDKTVRLSVRRDSALAGSGLPLAHGGPVVGPGTETSDSVPAWLSRGEHVLTAREVRGLGGHDEVERLRAAARQGMLRLAQGGPVGGSSHGPSGGMVVNGPLIGEMKADTGRFSFKQVIDDLALHGVA